MAEFFAQAFYDSACRDLLFGPIFMSRVPALSDQWVSIDGYVRP